MSTPASIIIALPEGKFKGISLNYDGGLSRAGSILKNTYNTFEKVLELVNGGDLSVLGNKIGTKHRFGIDRPEDSCVYYIRDRDEGKHSQAQTFMSLPHVRLCLQLKFNYLFLDGRWYSLPAEGPWREPYLELANVHTGY